MIYVQNIGTFDIPPSFSDTTEFNNFNQIARTLLYSISRFKNNGNDLSPYVNKKNFYGALLTEINKQTKQTVFSGTVRNLIETKTYLEIEATEPLVNYLDFIAETVEYKNTSLLNDSVAGNAALQLDFVNFAPYSKIRFLNSAQEYLVTKISGNTVEIIPPLRYSYTKNETVIVMTSVTKTAAESIKNVFTLAGIPLHFIGSSFDFYHLNDLDLGLTFFQNFSIADNVTVREYLQLVLDLSGLRLFTRNGTLEISRVGEYQNVSKTVLTSDTIFNVKRYYSFDKLLYGYFLPYKNNDADFLFAERYLDEKEVVSYDNRALFSPIKSLDPNSLRIAYSSKNAADYIGNLLLNYYKTPRLVIECDIKFIDPRTKDQIILYVGDGVNVIRNKESGLWQCAAMTRDSKNYTLRATLIQ